MLHQKCLTSRSCYVCILTVSSQLYPDFSFPCCLFNLCFFLSCLLLPDFKDLSPISGRQQRDEMAGSASGVIGGYPPSKASLLEDLLIALSRRLWSFSCLSPGSFHAGVGEVKSTWNFSPSPFLDQFSFRTFIWFLTFSKCFTFGQNN